MKTAIKGFTVGALSAALGIASVFTVQAKLANNGTESSTPSMYVTQKADEPTPTPEASPTSEPNNNEVENQAPEQNIGSADEGTSEQPVVPGTDNKNVPTCSN